MNMISAKFDRSALFYTQLLDGGGKAKGIIDFKGNGNVSCGTFYYTNLSLHVFRCNETADSDFFLQSLFKSSQCQLR